MDEIKNSDWLGSARRWWPDYAFHFTDIQNVVSILKNGALYSRSLAESLGLMVNENASVEIINQTSDEWKNFVRLYFRPRSPTQFSNEGFRPLSDRQYGAHCPVPVCLLFDISVVLDLPGARFSDGNLARGNVTVYDSVEDLREIPFQSVYHDEGFDDEERNSIIFHRNAEIIIPDYLSLDSLRFIACRSQAEFETILYLLPQNVANRLERIIGLGDRMNLFFKR